MQKNIKLTKPLEKWVLEQAEAKGLKNADAYLCQLVREEQRRHAKQYLLQKLEEGRASGYVEVTDQLWEECKQKVIANFQAKRAKKLTKVK